MRGSRPAFLSFDEQVRFEGKVKIHSKMFKRTREVRPFFYFTSQLS